MKLKRIKKVNHLKHIFFIILAGFLGLIAILIVGNIYFEKINPHEFGIKMGVSYTPSYAKSLGLDWKKTYLQILDELGVKYLRIPTYWKEIEPFKDQYDFSQTDFLISEADKRGVKVLMVLGVRQPRWPECHAPRWALDLPFTQRQAETLGYVKKVVEKYKGEKAIWGWQIENEPLFSFGRYCDRIDRDFLKQEVELVKQLDPTRPVVITDSGELRPWRTPMRLSDVFGTTLYRTVYNNIFGYFYWPLPPAFYNLKSSLVRELFAQNNQKTIIVELQTEPWLPKDVTETSLDEQLKAFTTEQMKDNIKFAKRTGFDEIYLWGVEWWYYMAIKNYPQYIEIAKMTF